MLSAKRSFRFLFVVHKKQTQTRVLMSFPFVDRTYELHGLKIKLSQIKKKNSITTVFNWLLRNGASKRRKKKPKK